jgi:hypothetical protein
VKAEPGEALVHCQECNAYLWSVDGNGPILIKCPYKCKREHDGSTHMTVREVSP